MIPAGAGAGVEAALFHVHVRAQDQDHRQVLPVALAVEADRFLEPPH
jgi:hypothetical protein